VHFAALKRLLDGDEAFTGGTGVPAG
jgi:hypothetical protein